MNPLFVDIEMPIGRPEFIMAIGIVSYKGDIIYESLVKPFKNKKNRQHITSKIIQITGIHPKMLENAPLFRDVYFEIKKYAAEGRKIYAWGGNDRMAWDTTCEREGLPKLWEIEDWHMELKRSFSVRNDLGLNEVYTQLVKHQLIEREGLVNHKAIDDAKMLRDIYKAMHDSRERCIEIIDQHIIFEKERNRLVDQRKGIDYRLSKWEKEWDFFQKKYGVLLDINQLLASTDQD